jgi:hypothetical protein
MMTLQAMPVTIENGVVRAVDGSVLPQHAYAVLVILPSPAPEHSAQEWQRPFDEFFAFVQDQSMIGLDNVSDEELNALIHTARQTTP